MNSFNKPTNIDGWNDPPANLALSDNISTKRVLLNKRVPYTNQDLSSTNTRRNKKKNLFSFFLRLILALNTLTAPPPCSSSSSTVAISTSTPSESESSLKSDLLAIEEINEIFQKQIKKLENSPNIEVNILSFFFLKKFIFLFLFKKKVLEDINKKFQMMHNDWCQEKLSLNTKQTLANIFRELDSDHVQEAFDMHIILVRNASSEVCLNNLSFIQLFL